jgi:hypothetical protein
MLAATRCRLWDTLSGWMSSRVESARLFELLGGGTPEFGDECVEPLRGPYLSVLPRHMYGLIPHVLIQTKDSDSVSGF